VPTGSALLLQDVVADLQKLGDASFPVGVFDVFLLLADIGDVPGEALKPRAVLSSFAVYDQIVGRRWLGLPHHVCLVPTKIPIVLLLQDRAQAQLRKGLRGAVCQLHLMSLATVIASPMLLLIALLSSLLQQLGS